MSGLSRLGQKNTYSLFIFVLLISSCASVNVTEEVVYDSGLTTVEAMVEEEEVELDFVTQAIFTNATIYFDFDKFNLSNKSIQTLKSAVSAMKDNESINIVISGHADERGTREYNLALGERRAQAVKDYFVINGISKNRISTKSYGEEKPISYGSDENSYAKNRRAEIN